MSTYNSLKGPTSPNLRKALNNMLLVSAIMALLLIIAQCKPNPSSGYMPISVNSDADREESLEQFDKIATVLRHPRCINCHPNDDYPRQGDDMHRHLFNVQRGPDERGVPNMKCTTCHQSSNNDISGVPGAPEPDDSLASRWHLAPISMGWIGLNDAELGARLLNKEENGNMSVEDLIVHMRDDPLVLWGWDPGGDREPIPIAHDEFVKILMRWAETGAAIPTNDTQN